MEVCEGGHGEQEVVQRQDLHLVKDLESPLSHVLHYDDSLLRTPTARGMLYQKYLGVSPADASILFTAIGGNYNKGSSPVKTPECGI